MIPPDLENTGIFDRVCPKNLPGHTNEKKKEVGEDKLGPMERELMIEGVDDKVFGREGGGGPAQGTSSYKTEQLPGSLPPRAAMKVWVDFPQPARNRCIEPGPLSGPAALAGKRKGETRRRPKTEGREKEEPQETVMYCSQTWVWAPSCGQP